MSRVHKYRAYDTIKKVMVEVDELRYFLDDNNKLQLENIWFTFPNSLTRQLRKLEDVELMEFTGLHDRNDKEIYEGDIIRYDFKHGASFWVNKISKVEKDIKITGFTPFNKQSNPYMELSDIEVIGNIFENPKYLEG